MVYGKWQDQEALLRVLTQVPERSAPFFFCGCAPRAGADEGAENAFFPASNTISITRLLASRFFAEMARV